MLDRKVFFDNVREIDGSLSQSQVDGFEVLLDAAAEREVPRDDLAYVLATVWWETNRTMQPVREAYWLSEGWRRRNLRYHPYYGRGYVQLTWSENYEKATRYFKDVLGIDVNFVTNPDKVMVPEYAAIILIVGMTEGWFTGRSMSDTIDNVVEPAEDLGEFIDARRVVNGTDRDDEIADIAMDMQDALIEADYSPGVSLHDEGPSEEPEKSPPPAEPVEETGSPWMALLRAAVDVIKYLTKGKPA